MSGEGPSRIPRGEKRSGRRPRPRPKHGACPGLLARPAPPVSPCGPLAEDGRRARSERTQTNPARHLPQTATDVLDDVWGDQRRIDGGPESAVSEAAERVTGRTGSSFRRSGARRHWGSRVVIVVRVCEDLTGRRRGDADACDRPQGIGAFDVPCANGISLPSDRRDTCTTDVTLPLVRHLVFGKRFSMRRC